MIEYLLLCIGIILLGDMVFLPLVYLASVDSLHLATVLGIAFVANLASDYGWYWIGSRLNREKVYAFFKIRQFEEKHARLIRSFDKHSSEILLYSKFAYGLRPPVRILYGMHKLSLKRYFLVNIVSSGIWLIAIWLLAKSIGGGLQELKKTVWGGEVAILTFGLAVVGLYFLGKYLIGKYLALPLKDLEKGDPSGNSDI